MKAIIILDKYPPYLTPGKLYEVVEQSQIENDIYFVLTDTGSTTSVHISQIRFLDEIRNEKLYKLLEIKDLKSTAFGASGIKSVYQ